MDIVQGCAVTGIDRDATPACVNICQARALTFGDLDDPNSNVSKLIRDKSGFVLHPEYGTDPSVWYVDYRHGGRDNVTVVLVKAEDERKH